MYIQNTGLVSEFANDESGQRDHYEKDYAQSWTWKGF